GRSRIVAEIALRLLHAFAGFNERRKVHDPVETRGQQLFKLRAIGQITLDKRGAGGQQGPGGMAEVVVDHYRMAALEKGESHHPTNVPSSSSDQNSHDPQPPILYAVYVTAASDSL